MLIHIRSFGQFLISIRIQDPDSDPDPDSNSDPKLLLRIRNTGISDSDLLHFFSFNLGRKESYNIQHCFICRPSDSTVPTDAGIEPRTVATGALAVRRSNH
jgi:hypothetical protein